MSYNISISENHMDLNKHLVGYDNTRPFHNNGLAIVANGNHFGSTSDISFDQRQQIERNRQLIASYQRSSLGNLRGSLRAKPVVRPVLGRRNIPQRPSLQQHNSISSVPRHFKEPPARNYNPFS